LVALKVVESVSQPVTIFCENMSAIKVAKDPKFHIKSKHIEGRFHYIRDVLNRLKTIRLVYLASTSMVADPLNYFLSILEIWDFRLLIEIFQPSGRRWIFMYDFQYLLLQLFITSMCGNTIDICG
jgi:hypothetical protein